MNYNVTSAGSFDSALNRADAVVDERRFNMKKRMAMTLAALALSVIMAVIIYTFLTIRYYLDTTLKICHKYLLV